MPRLVQKQQEDDLAVETLTVCELMERFYELYVAMADDPCLEDLADDVAQTIVKLEDRRSLAIAVATEESQEVQSHALH